MFKASKLQKPKIFQRFTIPGIFWGVLALFILFGVLRPGSFFSMPNMMFLMRNTAVLVIAAIGMTFAILVSQVDLSVGAVMSFSGVISAVLIREGFPVFVAIVGAILVGVLVGLINGTLIAKFKFDFWIVTFGTMGICAGLALVVADGRTIPVSNATFAWIGNGRIGTIFVMVWLAILMVAIMQLILSKTKFGHKIYAIGGSEQNSILSGIPVIRNRIYVYMISGMFAAMAGIILATMGSAASPVAGVAYSFEAIAAVIIGGATFDGGKGSLFGTVLGALMLRVIASGLNLLGVAATWQQFIIGFVVVLIIVIDVLYDKRNKRNDLRRRYVQ
ncbi:MAG: ABC transporter permease [Oscillospiraceae bacterium]|nr:ABC transporter permease [Oscillospiraceae bacterium]